MSRVQETIDVDVPVSTAYNQWTQFEQFPMFMEGVEEITQIDDRHNHWKTKIAGVSREFDTEIVDQVPDDHVAWRTVTGEVKQSGMVSFQPLDASHTRIVMSMDYQPEGLAEKAADMMNMLDRQVKGDLKRFKNFIEKRGAETGGYRGKL
ncbi:SRPBCC family protein [Kitasatospora aureofaciens]|uniref:Cyclase n=1 Tax=Kitasatospora aureofaciens TaxID=1894 RepID=A0A1E7N1R4_KITAU|nr:SRPBCC family protein [Kitasatospora aureofaciens]ARF82011.1 cyclase [Kitasatospora aureofaciens]OEV34624.1 cyclase [Kitasatospora aureofaciens]GGV01647.1 cyclase [Kitasatospora aureofaciens]